jgi:hypothetical protein
MVSNSVAIQTGTDPSTARMAFYWGRDAVDNPAPFVANRGSERLWFGNGVRVVDRLVLFLNRTVSTDTGLGFESVGWTAVLVDNPDAEPSAWQIRSLETPSNPLGILVGFEAIWHSDSHVYAFGSADPIK